MNSTISRQEISALKQKAFTKLYSSLNDMQRKAVCLTTGPLLVLAGAGTGKTTVLVNRIAHIMSFGCACEVDDIPKSVTSEDIEKLRNYNLLEKNELRELLKKFAVDPCPSYNILAITFTNKAANEMKTRLSNILGEAADDLWVGTFHSICVRILRAHADKLGYTRSFTIYDADDSKRLVSQCMKQLNIDEKAIAPKYAQNCISRAKDELITPEVFTDNAPKSRDPRTSSVATVYELYQHTMRENNAMDFDDLIFNTVTLLKNFPEVRKYYTNRFKYISVDEYQDTNIAQFTLTYILSTGHHNIMAVGDDDQSIYKFRGATVKNILGFDKYFDAAQVIKLEQNYRSTANILAAANSVIRNNVARRGKELWTQAPDGAKVRVKRVYTQNDEAKFIISTIRDLVNTQGLKFSDCAVLYRINAQSNALENMFAKSGIPYRILGGLRFYERKEIKDMLAYLTVINNPRDDLRLKRIINEPKRKIGDSTIAVVEGIATDYGISIFDVMMRCDEFPVLAKVSAKLSGFTRIISQLLEIANTRPLEELFEPLLELTGYREMLINSGLDEDRDRLRNIEELFSNIKAYCEESENATLEGFLQDIALITDVDAYDKDADAVVMMTVHSAKGLEFPAVFLPGLEDGIFPGMSSLTDASELEEERRLAYVAMTRAEKYLYMLHTDERMLFGKTQRNPKSTFLNEIPDTYIETDAVKRTFTKTAEPEPTVGRKRHIISTELTKDTNKITSLGKTTGYDRFAAGDRVRHMTFGQGVIQSVTEMGADMLYEVVFDNFGTKKLMATYAKLTKIN